MSSEKFYVQLLSQTISTYLTNLPDDLQYTLSTYLSAIRRIYEFHSVTFHPKLLQCDAKVTIICDLFRTHFEAMSFNVYHTYAANVSEAQKLLQNYTIDNVSLFLIGLVFERLLLASWYLWW